MAKPIEFKAGSLHAMSAVLREIDNVRLADALQVMLGGIGEFFAGEPAVIDVTQVTQFPTRIDWPGLQSLLRRYGLQPVALRGAPEALHAGARKAGLAILDGLDKEPQLPVTPATETPPAPEPVAAPAPSRGSPMVIDRTIRSGQQIYARGSDLIVLGAVSNGAEVIADGNVHCYGPLRGRALAGASGERSARIFSSNFGPELIAVAGVYRTFEQGIPQALAGRAVQARLQGEGEQASLLLETLITD
ncbi:MAG: septum site-determining protein MinC [Candidatus Dactylopiibacterium carminicum]|uniref:Probable septum site-determining protein MinC n=1 Tax=Candidatus Dactylopiibacterium carminicum TaxID=857335 RepID=A0A272ETL3_9RHOO|nr:septum site-determining protein MinC [Candidatus Dactylopiibacterium carminicum]KAF7599398.1 septum site-determining protein MinC [Candidatus Dactylopiibacterium carminicum]PAS93444.1 MAG: septum site-determining protein MinC [Candidatus Dactylopiibacterium carminicum]PAS95963.1 MAG: septum site-determining protein MinC [Candidatus Dactylopiibacterium carminicum]PAS99407.1 MAG: septum site-determining protein MinC [Candidatus Dactylopiibacterium carminicum]